MRHETERFAFTLSVETLRHLDAPPAGREAQPTQPTTTVNTIHTGCC